MKQLRRVAATRKPPGKRKPAPAAAVDLESNDSATLRRELAEAREQQNAVSDILRVIATSPGDMKSVFNSVAEHAARICGARFVDIIVVGDGALHHEASFGNLRGMEPGETVRLDRTTVMGRSICDREVVQVADMLAADEFPLGRQLALKYGHRTTLAVPLLHDDRALGTILVRRIEVRPFEDKHIALLKTFADQAAIAIENARLFDEVQARTRALQESLEYQTATGEILTVISRSPTDVTPVFDIIGKRAEKLCDADVSVVSMVDDELIQLASVHGIDGAGVEAVRRAYPMRLEDETITARTARSGGVVHVPDVLADTRYQTKNIARAAGYRACLGVPMIRDGEVVGTIFVARSRPGLFEESQVQLLKTFADQAVIAIGNVRLFDEVQARTEDLRESLQQQTATADVLKVISRSTFDLQTVLDTLTESAARLCGADMASIGRQGEHGYAHATNYNLSKDWIELTKSLRIQPGRESLIGRVLAESRVVQIADVLADPEYIYSEFQKAAGYRTVLGVPLLRQGHPIGVLFLGRKTVELFTDKQIELVSTFADQAVIAIENVRLFDEVQARTEDLRESLQQQTATAEVLKVISRSTFDLQPVLRTLVQSARELCNAQKAMVLLRDGEVYRIGMQIGYPAEFEAYVRENPIEPDPYSGAGRAAFTGQVAHFPDVLADPDYRLTEGLRLGRYRALLSVPLLREGQVVGVFSLGRDQPEPFTPRQIELVQTFADQAVIAIENVRLFDEVKARTEDLRESLQQQTATAEVLKVISRSTFDLQIVLDTLVQSAARLSEANYSFIFRREGERYHLVASHGFSPDYRRWMETQSIEVGRHTLVGRTALDGRTVHIPDVLADPEYTWGESIRRGGFRTMLGIPLMREGVPIGVIAACRSAVSPFSPKQIELVTTFADQAVIAIENVRLFDEVKARTEDLRESLQQQTATAEVLKVISRSTFDLPTVLQTLVESAAKLCDAEKATITRQKDGVLYRGEFYGFSDEFMEYVRNVPVVPDRGSATARALLEGKVVHIPDVREDPDYTFNEAQKLGDFRTIIGVPMLREGKPIGVIVMTRSEVRPFTDKQIELATTFADQAAIAIENVRLFDSVEARTRELMQSLEELRTAQNRLVQTEKLASLGQLTAGIAHEIKNPLNFVNNFSAVSVELLDELQQALPNTGLDDKARAEIDELANMLRGNLDKILQHGRRADSIVKNMLLHSREGSGERRPVDVNNVVDESLNLAYHGARAESQEFRIRLERSFDPAAGEVELFPQEITRVFLNLISNGFYAAMKRKAEALDGYEPMLTAATRNLGDRVEIRIRDNGSGIPPEVKEKMFNPFFTTKPPGEGTGLGLSLSYDIVVKQHAGSIEVDTEPGEFTEFRVILPRAAATSRTGADR